LQIIQKSYSLTNKATDGSNNINYRHQSIGVHGVQTPPVFGRVVSTYMWTDTPEFLTT